MLNIDSEKEKILNIASCFFEEKFHKTYDINECKKYWNEYQSEYFKKFGCVDFYKNWVDMMGICAIMINIEDQLARYRKRVIYEFYEEYKKLSTSYILDFGCGTATVSFLIDEIVNPINNTFYLIDFKNLSSEFVEYRVHKHNTSTKFIIYDNIDNIDDDSLDLVLCVDVLEHVTKPSNIIRSIYRKLKKNGKLILKISFGGECIEHIAEAETDWSNNYNDIFKNKFEQKNKYTYYKL